MFRHRSCDAGNRSGEGTWEAHEKSGHLCAGRCDRCHDSPPRTLAQRNGAASPPVPPGSLRGRIHQPSCMGGSRSEERSMKSQQTNRSGAPRGAGRSPDRCRFRGRHALSPDRAGCAPNPSASAGKTRTRPLGWPPSSAPRVGAEAVAVRESIPPVPPRTHPRHDERPRFAPALTAGRSSAGSPGAGRRRGGCTARRRSRRR